MTEAERKQILEKSKIFFRERVATVSYTHLTLPTN